MLAFVYVAFLLAARTTVVYSLNFTLSKPRVVLRDTGKLLMSCHVTENDVSSVYNIQIRREKNPGWDTLAIVDTSENKSPTLGKGIVGDRDIVVRGILDTEFPHKTHLTLDMNILEMISDDAGVYRCEMTYKSSITGNVDTVERNATLLIDGAERISNVSKEADNKAEVRADISDNAQQCTECDAGNYSVTVGAILGVTNSLTVLYAAYLTAVIRRSRERSFDGSLCHGKCEPEPTATVAKQGLAVDQQTYSVSDDEDTYDLSK
ncbi:uncharacterized protein LOC123560347 [Mercenaria mercenaria]|uniref:uncharacterized protein LOC123560347 n=1 Tax=Mercenaria mercenaria TaxID=6596 RepID=UPI00234FA146|nr:uncharacterized protein LOC123560347 [Mercenaria mercenaria]